MGISIDKADLVAMNDTVTVETSIMTADYNCAPIAERNWAYKDAVFLGDRLGRLPSVGLKAIRFLVDFMKWSGLCWRKDGSKSVQKMGFKGCTVVNMCCALLFDGAMLGDMDELLRGNIKAHPLPFALYFMTRFATFDFEKNCMAPWDGPRSVTSRAELRQRKIPCY